MSFQSSILSSAQSLATAAGVKSVIQQGKDVKKYAEALEKVQAGEDVKPEDVPKEYQGKVEQAQNIQQAQDKATAETALSTAERLMGKEPDDIRANFRLNSLMQRQHEQETRHTSRERMLENLYGKK